uniref:Protein rogdi homolog n=1 Tax=Panagrellus redivivus TaxID=6233 RepID=A0A7E4W1E3_PANRE
MATSIGSCPPAPPSPLPPPSQPLSKTATNMSINELSAKEGCWLQAHKAGEIFRELECLLRDICNRLKVNNKVENLTGAPQPSQEAEKYTLVSRSHQDVLKATVTLLNENIIQAEITLKHLKMAGGVFRSTAIPNVQWKVQQLQDTGNQCARALQLVIKSKQRYDRCVKRNGYDGQSESLLLSMLTGVKDLISEARTCLTMPRKKSLLELCQFQPTKCFNPPLAPDILLSYYISSTKIVCAAYQVVTLKQNGSQSVSVYQAEAQLPHLVDVLHSMNAVFSRAQDVINKFNALKLRSDIL